MIIWYFFYRRKALQARKFTKLDDAASPSAPPNDPEKQMQQVPSVPPPVLTTTPAMPSPLSPTDSGYAAFDQFVQNPSYIRMGSALITPTSPDPKDPFGERAASSLLGPLSAGRDSAGSKLGPTALGNNRNGSSTLALAPRSRIGSPSPSALPGSPARQSEADPATEHIPGMSPYWGGRLAVTPDNSLASNADSILRKHASAGTTTSVSSVEIDRILEMATIYSASAVDLPELAQPQPAALAPATLRSSAYMAGRESQSRRQSVAPALGSPLGSGSGARSGSSSLTHSRNNSSGAQTALSHSTSYSTLRLNRAFRDPPLAPLPSSPLPSPGGGRTSFSFDADADEEGEVTQAQTATQTAAGRESRLGPPAVLPLALPGPMVRNATASTRGSVYSQGDEGDEDVDVNGFLILQPPPAARRN